MSDLISRQAAIESLKETFNPSITNFVKAKMAIDNLPSAQPEIIRCKDCENWDTTWQNDWAKNYHYCPLIDGTRNGNWYCADAERRTDE